MKEKIKKNEEMKEVFLEEMSEEPSMADIIMEEPGTAKYFLEEISKNKNPDVSEIIFGLIGIIIILGISGIIFLAVIKWAFTTLFGS